MAKPRTKQTLTKEDTPIKALANEKIGKKAEPVSPKSSKDKVAKSTPVSKQVVKEKKVTSVDKKSSGLEKKQETKSKKSSKKQVVESESDSESISEKELSDDSSSGDDKSTSDAVSSSDSSSESDSSVEGDDSAMKVDSIVVEEDVAAKDEASSGTSSSDSESESVKSDKSDDSSDESSAPSAEKASDSSGESSSASDDESPKSPVDDVQEESESEDSSESSSSGSEDESSGRKQKDINKTRASTGDSNKTSFTKLPKTDGQSQEKSSASSQIFVRNLPWSVNDDDMHEFFSDCGKIVNIKWNTTKDTGRFAGTGLIDFENPEAAAKAMAKNGLDVKGRDIGVHEPRSSEGGDGFKSSGNKPQGGFNQNRPSFERKDSGKFGSPAGGKPQRGPTPKPKNCRTIFCGNLSFDITDESMSSFFTPCGEIKQIRWVNKDGEFKGCGFVEFMDSTATDKAIQFNGRKLLGKPIRIDFAEGRNN